MTKTFFGLLASLIFTTLTANMGYGQTPTPTPITKPDPPTVQTPSTVGRITKWTGASKSGIGIIGDSLITESGGNIGIDVTSPSDKLTVGGTLNATGAINTSTQYNIGGSRVLSITGTNNVLIGAGAGQNNTAPDSAFFGASAGQANTTGVRNSFFGSNAGRSNTFGGDNAFFGFGTGQLNNGSNNGFFGAFAGRNNTTGQYNNFFGSNAGISNTTGNNNSFF